MSLLVFVKDPFKHLNYDVNDISCPLDQYSLHLNVSVSYFAAWIMHFQIMMKERLTKCIFKVNLVFRTSILLLHVSALRERHLHGAQSILMKLCLCYVISATYLMLLLLFYQFFYQYFNHRYTYFIHILTM
jgi:hypothetical protein